MATLKTVEMNIFPADAGVNPMSRTRSKILMNIPRGCGGEPTSKVTDMRYMLYMLYIPRGCGVNLMQTVSIDITVKLFLADAWKV